MTVFHHDSRQSVPWNIMIAADGIVHKKKLLLYPSHLPRFYSDEVTWTIDMQFLWGPGLLISPVLDPVGLTLLVFIT